MNDTLRFFGLRGHCADDVLIDRSGALYAVLQVSGIPSDLAGDDAVMSAHRQDNALMLGVSDDRLEWWEHYCLVDGLALPELEPSPSWMGRRFDAAYRAAQPDPVCRQSLFITLVRHPVSKLRARLSDVGGDYDLAAFQEIVGRVASGLAGRYRTRRLGLRDGLYSEAGEAWMLALLNRDGALPIGTRELGPCIMQDRVVFGYRGGDVPAGVFELVRNPSTSVFGSVLSFLQPPSRTRPTMLDALRNLRIPMTLTNSARLRRRGAAVQALQGQQNRMDAARDPSVRQRDRLGDEAEQIQDGEVAQVVHHFSVSIFADRIDELNTRVALAQSALSDVGITAHRETTSLKAAYYAQIPGNGRWSRRRDPIKSTNMLALAAKHAATTLPERSRWGGPLLYFRTTAGTALPFHWHVPPTPQTPKGDLGNTFLFGRAGSGKTALAAALALSTLRVPRVRVVIFDRDLGLYPMVRAAGGSYLRRRGDSGWAPLRGLADTPVDREFLWDFVQGLIVSDGRGPITQDEGGWLGQAIEREMRKPVEMRSLRNVGAVLGMRSREGAAARLQPWCRGEARGWAFDGETDTAHDVLTHTISGSDTTDLLSNPLICGPALAYQFHLVNSMANGDPLVLLMDEVWAANQVPVFRERNNAWLKTGRKKEIVLVMATQSAGDALKSPIRDTLLQQVPRRIYFGEERPSREDLIEGMGLTDAEFRAVTETLPNLPYSFLVQQPGGGYVARMNLAAAPGAVAMLSGRTSTAALVDQLIAEYGPEPTDWAPHFERLAPGIVDNPTLGRAA